ncbi:hypothetical protein P3S68_033633 [Capsicum galapagoense]
MKLRLDRVLQERYEADSLEEALASTPVDLEWWLGDVWYLGVAKPSIVEMHGQKCGSKVYKAECWYMAAEKMDFYNLGLSNTNVVDHTIHYFNKKNDPSRFRLTHETSFVSARALWVIYPSKDHKFGCLIRLFQQ